MMADSVEAASRSLKEHTEESIKQLVDKIIDGQIADGLLKSAPLTFRDVETINLELILSDMDVLDRRIDKTQKLLKGDKGYQAELDFLKRVKEALDEGKPARSVECSEEEAEILSSVALLTNKPTKIKAEIPVDLPRPRNLIDPKFVELRKQVTELIRWW